MSTNLEYRARERQRKRESRRQASEAQRENGRQRSRARDKKKETFFLLEEQHENFVPAVTKWEMLAATNQMQGEDERQWNKVNENTYHISSIKSVTKGTEKQATKNVQFVSQHCCKTSWIAMLRDLPPTSIETCLTTNWVGSCTFFVARFSLP